MKHLKRFNESTTDSSVNVQIYDENGILRNFTLPSFTSLKSEIDRLRKEEEFKDFKEFCKSNLAFLIDAGFTVDVSYAMYGGGFMLEVMRKGNGLFNWEEIKYDFIPFIELLQISEFSKKDIDYKSKVLFSTKTGQYEITFESILDDTVGDLSHIKYITIHI